MRAPLAVQLTGCIISSCPATARSNRRNWPPSQRRKVTARAPVLWFRTRACVIFDARLQRASFHFTAAAKTTPPQINITEIVGTKETMRAWVLGHAGN